MECESNARHWRVSLAGILNAGKMTDVPLSIDRATDCTRSFRPFLMNGVNDSGAELAANA